YTGTVTEFPIGIVGPDGTSYAASYTSPTASGITHGPDHNLWFAGANDSGCGQVGGTNSSYTIASLRSAIGRIDPDDGSYAYYIKPNGFGDNGQITLGPDGNLRFAGGYPGGSAIFRLDPNTGTLYQPS